MEVGESSEVRSRKRTESNGGSSDSDLSEGWNFVDQSDVNGNDTPSSDGESVEVIDAENESAEQGEDTMPAATVKEEGQLLATSPEAPVPLASETESPALSDTDNLPPVQEEMFDSSFCWFLFFATSAVLVSNLAFMAAENALDWNMDLTIDSPSFLRDLPLTPKVPKQDKYPNIISWADNEEVAVDTVEEILSEEAIDGSEQIVYGKIKHRKNQNTKWQKQSLKIENNEIGKYFKILSGVTTSKEAQNKFAQALLILDALHIGLNDLEEVVTEKSELHHVLEKQKDKLYDVLDEVEFGVSRSMERLAINILNKVHKLERRFENQWCKLEKTGYKEELKGLFYDCQGSEDKYEGKGVKDAEEYDDRFSFEGKTQKKHKVVENYQYEADKDSTGKVYSKPNNWGKSEEYYKLVKNVDSDENEKQKHTHKNKHDKVTKIGDKVDKVDKEKYKEESYDKSASKYVDDKSTKKLKHDKPNKKDDKEKTYYKDRNGKENKENNYRQTEKYKSSTFKDSKNEKNHYTDKSSLEVVGKFLKESCEKNQKTMEKTHQGNDYQKLKDTVDGKIRIPKDMFDVMFNKYCKQNDNSFKQDNTFKKEHRKGDFRGKNNENNFYKDKQRVIEDHKQGIQDIKNVLEFRIVDVEETQPVVEPTDLNRDKIIVPGNKPRQWIFSYEAPISDNETNLSGDWFIKAGESRSKTRWAHHRGDWWFDRSSHRRANPHTPNWFSGKRKNWFFRRAWAREQCRQSPQAGWCRLQDDTVTIPNASSNR